MRETAFIKRNAKAVVLGLSGGIDSAVVAALCAKALGKKKVLALIMPERKDSHYKDAVAFAKALGIEYKVIDIKPIVREFDKRCTPADKTARANIRARTRMTLLYYYSNLLNRRVAGTGNKSEKEIGYFTKWGDGAADFFPIAHIYKTDLPVLARKLGIPENIVRKKPSAGLWRGQTDEKELGISYEKIDAALKGKKKSAKVTRWKKQARHKKKMPPTL
ncbi:NAD+ synthase [archaeon]